MRFKSLLLTLLLAAPPAMAQSYDSSWGVDVNFDAAVTIDLDSAPPGEAIPDVAVFFDQLDPYGSWYEDDSYGYVFVPARASFVPYSNGYWKYTSYGLTWVSAEPFGWATEHYGRWLWLGNRWVWKPDTVWAPAWVQWRAGDTMVSWAPLGYDADAYVPDNYWRIVPTTYIVSRDLPRYYVRTNHDAYLADSRPIVRHYRSGSHSWIGGPDRQWLGRHRVNVTPQRYDLREIGRLDQSARRAAEQRAQQIRQRDTRIQREQQVQSRLAEQRRRADAVLVRQRAQQQAEQARGQQQRVDQAREQQRLNQQRDEQNRIRQQQRTEQQRVQQQREQQRAEQNRVQQQQAQQQRAEQAREQQRLNQQRDAQNRAQQQQRADQQRAQQQRVEQQRAQQQRAEQQRAQQQERQQQQRVEQQRAQQQRVEQQRAQQQRAEQQRAQQQQRAEQQRAQQQQRTEQQQDRQQQQRAQQQERQQQQRVQQQQRTEQQQDRQQQQRAQQQERQQQQRAQQQQRQQQQRERQEERRR